MSASQDQFYITCPSNDSMDVYPNNTVAEFTVKLDTPLELSGDYEVGMCEIQYPKSWNNVRAGANGFTMRYRVGENKKPFVTRRFVPPGYYPTVQSLIKVLNGLIAQHEIGQMRGFKIEYNEMTRRVKINCRDLTWKTLTGNPTKVRGSIKFRSDIGRILGFSGDKLVKSNTTVTSPYPAMPSAGFYNMYVYCDAIALQMVGNAKVPLLRILPVESKPDETYLAKRFSTIYYMPLAKQRMNTLEFKISDDSGRRVGFDHGKSVIALHFWRQGQRS